MNRKIIFIIVGALLVLVLMFVLWFWFFGRNKSEVLPPAGNFDTATDTTGDNSGNGTGGNGQVPIGTNTDTSNTTSGTSNGDSVTPSTGGQVVLSPSGSGTISFTQTPLGVVWVGGSIGGGGGSGTGGGNSGTGFNFNVTPINDINGADINGTPNITTITTPDGTSFNLAASIAVIALGCIGSYTAERLVISPLTEGINNVIDTIGGFFGNLFNINTPATPQFVNDTGVRANTSTETVSRCLARTIGKLAIQKITESTVDWINGGFNGKPAFVQDYNQFFTSIADQAAGEFIEGSGLAFLCSPFKLQVKIAIAQAYANRSSSSASSCTLSGVVGNVEDFVNGDWAQGGWQGFLSFTTEPQNNPYGAYITGQIQLGNYISKKQNLSSLAVNDNGYIGVTEEYDCKTRAVKDIDGGAPTYEKYGCKTRIVTPGSAIEASLTAALNADLETRKDIETLNLADSIDQILGALSNALVTKLLYSGLTKVETAGNPSTPTSEATKLMKTLQTGVTNSTQYAGISQRAIADIQSSQQNLATLANCWSFATTSSTATPEDIVQGNDGFTDTLTKIINLQSKIDSYNAKITAANTSIASLQDIQTRLLLATTPADLEKVQARYQNLKTVGSPHIYTTADIDAADDERETLHGELIVINQAASQELAQCYDVRR